MELERKLSEHVPTPVPSDLLGKFPELSILVFEALDYLYDRQKCPVSKITLNKICLARGYLEKGQRGATKGEKKHLGKMRDEWTRVRGIDKYNDPNDNVIPVEMGEDEEAQLFASKIRQSLNEKYQAQYVESLEKAESIAVSQEAQLAEMREALANQEIENEALQRKLHEMEPVYKDALTQHGKMRAQNEVLQSALETTQATYDKLNKSLRAEFEAQYRVIIEVKDTQVADLQKQVEALEADKKAIRSDFMTINEEQRHVFIERQSKSDTKIAKYEEEKREYIEKSMEYNRKITRLSQDKAALELELKSLRES